MTRVINPFVDGISTFEERETHAPAAAYDEICEAMHLPPDATGDRLVVATRVMDLARTGVIDVRTIRERVPTDQARRAPAIRAMSGPPATFAAQETRDHDVRVAEP
jgi:hypothetical protein